MRLLRDLLRARGIEALEFSSFQLGALEVPHVVVTGPDAIPAWRTLRERCDEHGAYPVVIGSLEQLEFFEEAGAEPREPVESVLRAASALEPDPFAWAERRRDELAAQLRAAGIEANVETPEPDERPSDEVASFSGFATPNDIVSGRPHPLVAVALFPVRAGFEVPALVGWGGFNVCPYPEEHVSLLRHFEERFGAELVCMTHDVLELEVASPPTSFEAALPLARLMYAYCADIVDQGVGSVGALASGLVGATSWFFWWD